MNIENVIRSSKDQMKTKQINVRISNEQSKWLQKNNYSPSRMLQEAFKELGYKENE